MCWIILQTFTDEPLFYLFLISWTLLECLWILHEINFIGYLTKKFKQVLVAFFIDLFHHIPRALVLLLAFPDGEETDQFG